MREKGSLGARVAALAGLALASLVGCAGPTATLPRVTPERLESQTLTVQRKAVDAALAREARVRRLAWPIITENAALCPKHRPLMGWRLGDAETVRSLANGLKASHIAALGFDDTPRILSVAPGSPAEAAGLKTGDVIIGLDPEEPVTSLREIVRAVGDALEDWEEGQTLTLAAKRDGEEFTVDVTPVEGCDVRIISSGSNAINALASFRTITVYAGLVRALNDDDQLSFVIAHELAHIAGRHVRKGTRNTFLSGAALWAPPVYVLARVGDWVTSWPAEQLGAEAPPLTTAAEQLTAKAVGSGGFEAEADYIGLYMHVRAGRSVETVQDVFQLFSTVSPRTSWLEVTHPVTPERMLNLQSTAEEIAAKQAAGTPLIPEGWAEHIEAYASRKSPD
ncbi:MAG: M48 family metallopeptidase [Pseudomonadota bacterium]